MKQVTVERIASLFQALADALDPFHRASDEARGIDALPPQVNPLDYKSSPDNRQSSVPKNHEFLNDFKRAAKEVGVPESWATNSSLLELIRHESRFDLDAKNPASSAFGLFQLLKGIWNELVPEVPHGTEDPFWQAVGGFRYLKKKYKTPERAWAFWQATSKGDAAIAPEDLRTRAQYWIDKGYIGY